MGTFPWTCRVHFKNMSHIDLVRFETNVSWWLFRILWLFYRIAVLPCAGDALLLQIHPQVVSSAASSFHMLRTVAKQGAPHTSQGCSSQPGNVGGWSCARIPCHTDFTFDIVPWDLTSMLRVIHSTPSQKRYLEIVCSSMSIVFLWVSEVFMNIFRACASDILITLLGCCLHSWRMMRMDGHSQVSRMCGACSFWNKGAKDWSVTYRHAVAVE